MFAEKGYELLADDYKNNMQKLPYRCSKHPDKRLSISVANLKKAGCPYCASERHAKRQTGEGNHNWKGGLTELNFYLRQAINDWKKLSLSNADYRCFVTGERSVKLEVHHTKSYNQIRDEVLQKLGLPLYKTVGEYTPEQFEAIIKEFRDYHLGIEGVPLLPKVHKLFHKIYGHNADSRDLLEFKDRYLRGEIAA